MLIADASTVITISAWWCLAAALPVLLLGELLVRKIPVFAKVSIPAAVIGGMLIALIVLACKLSPAIPDIAVNTKQALGFWTWLTTTHTEWASRPARDVQQPFLIAFFCCVGLNASWSLARKGSVALVIYLLFCTLLTVVQNGAGAFGAILIGENPALGLLCGGVSLMGGFGTAAGLKDQFEQAGVVGADVVGVTSATFGVVVGCLIGGPIASLLVRRHKLDPRAERLEALRKENLAAQAAAAPGFDVVPPVDSSLVQHSLEPDAPGHHRVGHVAAHDNIVDVTELEPEDDGGFIGECLALARLGWTALYHLLILLACIKLGAYVSAYLGQFVTLPVQMGAMIVGVVVRNLLDLSGREIIRTRAIELLSGVTLGVFLTVFMIALDLSKLRDVAGPMLILLIMQVVLNAAIAYWALFHAMGRDYEAAALSAGYIGFGLGSTSNAVATLKALAREYGPAPRAMLIVTVVGGFLIDFVNILVINGFLAWFKA